VTFVPVYFDVIGSSKSVLNPKSITLIGESSAFVKNKKFSGFKSL
jgi:hypothetical protein